MRARSQLPFGLILTQQAQTHMEDSMKSVQRILVWGICLILLAPLAFANGTSKETTQKPAQEGFKISSKVPVTLYGFVAAQTFLGDSQLGSLGANQSAVAPNRVIDETTVTADDAFLAFTLQNSRVGLYFDPYDFGGKNFTIDARFEIDFFENSATATQALAQPRIRRLYTSIGNDSWRFLAGQEWELFAPLNTPTLNTGSNLWHQGNLGFRRPQLRGTYNYKNGNNGLELAASINNSSNSLFLNDNGNTTAIPMFQGRLGYWHQYDSGKLETYLSASYGQHRNLTAGLDDVTNWGVAVSVSAPIIKEYLTFMGEGHYGNSLNSQLSISAVTTDQITMGGWAAVQSQWNSWFETNVGYGMEDLDDDDVAALGISSNSNIFGNLKFKPVKQFIIGFEYNYLSTEYSGNGTSNAHLLMSNVMYSF